jgi:hypothetical protein
MGFLPVIIRSTEGVRAAKDRLLATAMSVDQSVQECGALDQSTRDNWGVFYTSVRDLTRQDVPFWGTDQFYEQVSLYESQLTDPVSGWITRLKTACNMNLPIFNLHPVDPEVANFLQLARYAMVIAGVAGSAYVVGQIVSVLPKGRGR